MTKEEAKKITEGKVQKIKQLARDLMIQIRAEEVIMEDNTIQKVVIFKDLEQYPIVTREPLPESEEKKDVEDTTL